MDRQPAYMDPAAKMVISKAKAQAYAVGASLAEREGKSAGDVKIIATAAAVAGGQAAAKFLSANRTPPAETVDVEIVNASGASAPGRSASCSKSHRASHSGHEKVERASNGTVIKQERVNTGERKPSRQVRSDKGQKRAPRSAPKSTPSPSLFSASAAAASASGSSSFLEMSIDDDGYKEFFSRSMPTPRGPVIDMTGDVVVIDLTGSTDDEQDHESLAEDDDAQDDNDGDDDDDSRRR